MSVSSLRFGILTLPDAPFPELVERWRWAEEAGFDAIYVADHTGDYRDLSGWWFDGWTALGVLASSTTRVRVGTLVTNPILRHPVVVAKAAVAVDHLSGGRLELGIGTGIAGFDHRAVGVPYWRPRERAARFAEYVRVVDEVLTAGGSYRFHGRYLATDEAPMTPAPRQRPRPPLTVGGQSPTVLRLAAERADCWNTHGPFGWGVDDILELTRRQNEALDRACEAHGRDPAGLRRSLLLHDALDAWASPRALEEIVSRFTTAGVVEYVLFWPPAGYRGLLEGAAASLLPRLRARFEAAAETGALTAVPD